jgi:hypothetical protein
MQVVAVEDLVVTEEAQVVLVVQVALEAVALDRFFLMELLEPLIQAEAVVVWEDKVELKAVLEVQAL